MPDSTSPEIAIAVDLLLIGAAIAGDMNEIERLLPLSNAKAGDSRGFTALIHAAHEGHARAVSALLPFSNANATDSFGHNALQLAVLAGHVECARLLLSTARQATRDEMTALHWAAFEGQLECLELLAPVSDLSAVNWQGETALMVAASQDRADCARFLLPRTPESQNKAGENALALAAHRGSAECVRLLLASENPNNRDHVGATPLIIAADCDAWDCVAALLPVSDAKAATLLAHHHQPAGRTALMTAVGRQSLEIVALLLPASDAKAVDAEGRTALMMACQSGGASFALADRLRLFDLLLAASDSAQKDLQGKTAFDIACETENWAFADGFSLALPAEAIFAFCKTSDSAAIAQRFPRWAARVERDQLAQASLGASQKASLDVAKNYSTPEFNSRARRI